MDGRPDRASRIIVDLLRSYAEETFVTQTELARRTGLEQSHISRTFNHRVTLTVPSMVALCDGLGVSPMAVMSEALQQSSA